MAKNVEKDALSGVETTGHEWDGLRELNNPLPKWWVYVFYATIAWAFVYWILYPAWPLGGTYTHGVLGWSQREEIVKSLADAKAAQAKYITAISAKPLADIQKDADLRNFAMTGGKVFFNDNCAPCHGAGGQGAVGFPNLNDDEWMWGGTLDEIYTTIKGGVRQAEHAGDITRGVPGVGMTAYGKDGILDKTQINDVSEYVLTFTNRSTDKAAAEKGAQIYAENCAACHGDKGQGSILAGIPDVGAPALNDPNWIWGGDKATIVATVTNGRAGEMPSWGKRFDDATLKTLAIYVHNLGGGK